MTYKEIKCFIGKKVILTDIDDQKFLGIIFNTESEFDTSSEKNRNACKKCMVRYSVGGNKINYDYGVSGIDTKFNQNKRANKNLYGIISGKGCIDQLNEALEHCNLSKNDGIIKSMISDLAMGNSSEAIAEANSSYIDNDLTKTIKQLIKKSGGKIDDSNNAKRNRR